MTDTCKIHEHYTMSCPDCTKRKLRVYLGWPSTGQREDIHIYLLRDLKDRYGDLCDLILPDICAHRIFHDRARCDIVDEFLASNCDVLWQLDSDVCPPNHVLDLIAHHYDKWQVAGAPYPIANIAPGNTHMGINFTVYKGVDKATNSEQRGIYMSELPADGQEFVDGLATGCLFIKREVFAKMKKPWFEFKFDHETRRITEGEDMGFALKCHDLGIKFFVDYSMVCSHHKRVNLLEMSNFAMRVRNAEVANYVEMVKPEIQAAYKAAYEAGYKKGLAESRSPSAPLPGRTQAGIILPEGLRR